MSGRRILVGLVLVSFGSIVLIERLGGTAQVGPLLRTWWPLALLLVGASNLIRYSVHRWALVGPLVTMLIGAIALSFTAGFVDRPIYPLIWPAAIILVGALAALVGAEWVDPRLPYRKEFRQLACFRGKRITSFAPGFRRADLTVLLGFFELDLRQAELHPKATVNVNVVFGMVEVLVRDDVTVWERHPFLLGKAGLEAGTPPVGDARLTINVLGLFGSVRTRPPSPSRPRQSSVAGSSSPSTGQGSPGNDRPDRQSARRDAGSRGSRGPRGRPG
jgi:hypothetical protein